MAEKKVKITFEVDGITKTVNSVEELNKELGKTKKGADEAAKSQGFFSKRLDEAKEKLGNLKSSLGDVTKGFSFMSKGLSKVAQGLGLSSKAANIFGKTASAAIAATGIGLLIPLVISLINYFQNLEGGAKALKKVTEGLGAVVSNVGKAFKLLLSGDFAGAFNTIKDAVVEATEAVDDQFAAERRLSELRQKTIVENANLRKEIEAQKKILEDTTLSTEERLAALDKVNAATKQLQQNQIDETKEALARAEAEAALINNYKEKEEKLEEIAQLQADLIDQETALATIEYDAAKVGREIRQAEADELQAQADERKQNAEEVSVALQQLRLQDISNEREKALQTLEIQKQAALEELALKGATAEQLAEVEMLYDNQVAKAKEQYRQEDLAAAKEAADEEDKIAKESAEKQKAYDEAVRDAKIQAANVGFEVIKELAGENSRLGKAAAVAQATMNTFEGANKALAQGGILGSIGAGIVITQGLMNVKKILETKAPGDEGGSGGSVPSIAPPSAPQVDTTLTDAQAAFANQNPGETMTLQQNGSQSTIKAYVVAEEMTSTQEANKRIDDLARL
jgi:hypothetical protein